MQRFSWRVLVVIVLLGPAVVLADDAVTYLTDNQQADLSALSSEMYWREPGYASYWQISALAEAAVEINEAAHPIASLDFRDPGAFARVSKVRELSLLTLAEVGATRLFFGVNNDGLFGIHLGALPPLGDERCVELVRMPYLKNAEDAASGQ